jgi:hypothetical protein
VTLLETKKTALAALLKEIVTEPPITAYSYLHALRMRSQRLAEIVHLGQVDMAKKPYTQHVKRLAVKANNTVLFCALILHDVVEEGKELGVTLEFLKENIKLPKVIVDIVDCLTRRDGESYPEYARRILSNYQAQKGKIIDNIDNADVTRFDNPTREDVLRCTRYLEKAQYIKSCADFQLSQKYDFFLGLIAMHEVLPMAQDYTDRIRTEGKIEQSFYFGYEGQEDRSYVVHFDATIDQETDKTTAVISTYPSRVSLADWQIWVPQRQVIEFNTNFEALDYLHNVSIMLNAAGFIISRECLLAFRSPTMMVERDEALFVKALTNFYA